MPQFADLLAYSLIKLCGRLPLRWARALGASCGRLALRANIKMVAVTRQNIARCLPELSAAAQQQLVRDSVIETCTLAFEAAVIWRRDDQQIDALIQQVHGLEHLQALIAQGKGLIVLAPHLGNWEVFGIYLARFGPAVYLFQPPRLAKLGQLIRRRREKSGAHLVPTNRRGLAALLSSLKAGGISGILPDQTPNQAASGLVAPFFGQPAFTMTLAQKLLQNSGCLAIFGYAERTAEGFNIHFVPAPEALYSADSFTAVSALNTGVETCVRQCLPQYQWEYRRFKTKHLTPPA